MTALELAAAMVTNADAKMLEAAVRQAEGLFMAECAREDVPEAAAPIIARMARHLYAKIDAEGISAQSYSGASESIMEDWPADLRRAIHRYRRAVML